jgi:20S proteasome subunit beta 7
MCYAKRNKADPFYIEGILAGVKDGHKTLTFVDLYGTKFTDKYIATSFARSIASPIIDASYKDNISANDAKKIIIDSFKALIARHKLFSRSLVLVLVTEDGIFEDKVEIAAKYDYIGFKTREDLF